MRTREYLSPSAIGLFRKDKDEFYLRYLSDHRPAREPQTQPMSVGSAFDAYAKSFLHERLFGKGYDPRFDLDTIFTAQVEPQWRDWAQEAGRHCFNTYLSSGALADLMLELQQSVGPPRFEFEVKGVVGGSREASEITIDNDSIPPLVLLGKPDVFFINHKATHVILDWKVNGYLSKYNYSPMKGFVRLRSYKRENQSYKDVIPMDFHGMKINYGHFLEDLNEDWATQLAIYSWLCGCEIGEPKCIFAIDQLVCNANKEPGKVLIEIAEHRLRIKKPFQETVLSLAQHIWNLIHSKPFHYFEELSLADSQSRCDLLDERSKTLIEDPSFRDVL